MTEGEFAGRDLAILGLGLMGTSFGLALAGRPWRRVGWDPSPQAGRLAHHRGAVDVLAPSLEATLRSAGSVILAAPVRAILELLPQVAQKGCRGALVLDLGSSKEAVVEAMRPLAARQRPVGGHPFCGKVESGPAPADGGLFRGAAFALCPVPGADPGGMEEAERLVRTVGARPLSMEAAEHDRRAAAVSHVPYLVAVALLGCADGPSLELAAGGFRDATRLAATDARVGADLLLTNRRLREELACLRRELAALEDRLGQPEWLARRLEETRRRRLSLGRERGWE